MTANKTIHLKGEQIELLPQKAIYWAKRKTLLLADLHLGKVGTFRQAGIPIPNQLADTDQTNLAELLDSFDVDRCIILGDLFHSRLNGQWGQFKSWLTTYPSVRFELVMGNHDILTESHYSDSGIILHKKFLIEEPFVMVHDPSDFTAASGYYGLCGHIHPGVKLKGKAGQSITLPCFYFNDHYSVLPAFGAFTGFIAIETRQNDTVYVIAEDKLFKV